MTTVNQSIRLSWRIICLNNVSVTVIVKIGKRQNSLLMLIATPFWGLSSLVIFLHLILTSAPCFTHQIKTSGILVLFIMAQFNLLNITRDIYLFGEVFIYFGKSIHQWETFRHHKTSWKRN